MSACRLPQPPSFPIEPRTGVSPALGLHTDVETARAFFAVAAPAAPIAVVSDVSGTMLGGATSADLFVEFPDDGVVASFLADVVDPMSMGTPLTPQQARSICGVQVMNTRDRSYLYGDQRSEKSATVALAFGEALTREHHLGRRVKAGDRWRVKFQNLTSANNGLKAQAMFKFIPDPKS